MSFPRFIPYLNMRLLRPLILFCVATQLVLTKSNPAAISIEDHLKRVKTNIEANFKKTEGMAHFSAAHQYVREKPWGNYSEGLPVLVHHRVGHWTEWGNYAGIYFETIACQALTKMHYLAVNDWWPPDGPAHFQDSDEVNSAFLSLLPAMIVSNSPPPNRTVALGLLGSHCHCELFCWENGYAAWTRPAGAAAIRKVLSSALKVILKDYLPKYQNITKTTLRTDVDIIHVPKSKRVAGAAGGSNVTAEECDKMNLPLIPDVTLHFRCFISDKYGLLPFYAYARRIPKDARTVYISSDHPKRAFGTSPEFADKCGRLLRSLVDYLKPSFPETVILVKRGDDLFLTLARLTFSKVTVCAPSSFCLWPALANQNAVHFPRSSIVANFGRNLVNLTDSFHWIDDATVLHFNKDKHTRGMEQPVEEMLALLTAPAPAGSVTVF